MALHLAFVFWVTLMSIRNISMEKGVMFLGQLVGGDTHDSMLSDPYQG